jgi:myo-inositol-hexaphosphate 3-phosphohydrolase
MKIKLIIAKDKPIWKPRGNRQGFSLTNTIELRHQVKLLDFVENFIIDSIKLSLYENCTNYYLGYLQGKNLYVCYDQKKETKNAGNLTIVSNGLDAFIDKLDDINGTDIIKFYQDRFDLNLTTN